MSEWWTYRLSDFLMFSPRTYWRLVELYNREVWPAQILALATGLALLWLAASERPQAARIVAAALAAAWLWVGWAFHWQRYATINWAAAWLAAAFWFQALLLGVSGVLQEGAARPAGVVVRRTGWALAIAGLLLYPLAGLLAGRPWAQTESFGTMPDPTALATLGLVLAGHQPARVWICVIPVLSLVIGALTRALLSG